MSRRNGASAPGRQTEKGSWVGSLRKSGNGGRLPAMQTVDKVPLGCIEGTQPFDFYSAGPGLPVRGAVPDRFRY